MVNMPEQEDNGSETQLTNFETIGQGPLSNIFNFLSIQDIGRASLTCRAFRDAGRNDNVWYTKSLERYPPSTLTLAPGSSYCDWRDLRLDDNAENASLVIPFPKGLSSDYKYSRPDYFFECCITALQWNRTNDSLQIFFDCRGEADLRDPLSSSIAFVVHRPRPCRRELREELFRLNIVRQELRDVVERLEPHIKEDSDAAPRHLAALRALHISSHRLFALHRELQDCSSIAFSDLVTVVRPNSSEYHFSVSKPGHYKGWLQFDGISRIDDFYKADVPAFSSIKKAILQHGMDMVFTYANPVPVLPQMHQIDYHPVTLLHIPPTTALAETWEKEGLYGPHDELNEQFLNESVEEEQKRWEHVKKEMESGGRVRRGRGRGLGDGAATANGFDSWFV